MVRTLRPRVQKSYDVVAMQKKERYESRMARNAYYADRKRKKNAKAAKIRREERRMERLEKKEQERLKNTLPKLVMEKLSTLKEICMISRGEFYYAGEIDIVLQYYSYKDFDPFSFSIECNKVLLHEIQQYINEELDYISNQFNECIDLMIEHKRVDACNVEKLKSYKF